MSGQHTPFTYRADRAIADAAGLPLARCYANRGEESIGPLFAAAPQLLEAAQDAVKALNLLRQGLIECAPETIEMIDAHIDELWTAIAKARGEAA